MTKRHLIVLPKGPREAHEVAQNILTRALGKEDINKLIERYNKESKEMYENRNFVEMKDTLSKLLCLYENNKAVFHSKGLSKSAIFLDFAKISAGESDFVKVVDYYISAIDSTKEFLKVKNRVGLSQEERDFRKKYSKFESIMRINALEKLALIYYFRNEFHKLEGILISILVLMDDPKKTTEYRMLLEVQREKQIYEQKKFKQCLNLL